MEVTCSKVRHRQAGPPKEKVELSCSSTPGCACWPGCPLLSRSHERIGTMVSRGKLITIAPVCVGEMCSSMDVSDRDPWMPLPYLPCVPVRASEPILRVFCDPFTFGGRLPRLP